MINKKGGLKGAWWIWRKEGNLFGDAQMRLNLQEIWGTGWESGDPKELEKKNSNNQILQRVVYLSVTSKLRHSF